MRWTVVCWSWRGLGREDGGGDGRKVEGIASRMERRVNGLRGGLSHKRKVLDGWMQELIDAENAFDAVAYAPQAADRWLSRARQWWNNGDIGDIVRYFGA